ELKKAAPDKPEVLEATWVAVIQAMRERPSFRKHSLFIGGKSMGGRIASHVASFWDEPNGPGGALAGLIFFGYPLHPPGRPNKWLWAPLPQVKAPMLFIQGARDTFGTSDELEPVLKPIKTATLSIVEGGDHSLRASKSPAKQAEVEARILTTAID